MTYSMNESFHTNVLGKEVKFDIQPYTRGRGTITKCTPRVVKDVKIFDSYRGRMLVTYEVFDLEVTMTEGTHTGALWSGVPVSPAKNIAGTVQQVNSVTYSQLHDAAFGVVDMSAKDYRGEKSTIVIALCG